MPDTPSTVELLALESRNLDTTCYRGSAPLAQLARVSTADVFDQDTNPEGLQRDLSLKHAREAYEYVARERDPKLPRAFPEVVLNVRDKSVIKREPAADGLVKLTLDVAAIEKARTVKVSRVDGNHRLFFGAGDNKEREPLDAPVPFQLHIGLSRDQEAGLFSAINSEQKGLNTSHLAVIETRITPEEVELAHHPARVYARRLAEDVASPWHGLVHMGGSKAGAKEAHVYRPVNFIALENGVKRILGKAQYLGELGPDAQYGLIRAFWQAAKAVYPEAFDEPREYLVLKNLGVSVFSQVAATIIDRCLIANEVEVGNMVPFLLVAKDQVDWHKDSPGVAGMSGNRAVLLLAGKMQAKLPKTAAYIDPQQAEDAERTRHTGTLSADRTITLSTSPQVEAEAQEGAGSPA